MNWVAAWVRRIGTTTLLAFTLAWTSTAAVAWQFAGTNRLIDRDQLLGFSSLALVIGWGVARSRLNRIGLALTVAAWLLVIAVRTGGLEGRIASAVYELARFLVGSLADDQQTSILPALRALADLGAGFYSVGLRTAQWLGANATSQAPADPVAQNLVLSTGVSLNAFWAAWLVRRLSKPLPALLPAVATICAIGYSQAAYPVMLPASLLAMLSLQALLAHARRELAWRAEGVDYSEDVRLDIGATAGLLVVALVLGAALVPSVRWQDVIQSAQTFTRGFVAVRSAPGATGAVSSEPLPPIEQGAKSPFEPLRVTGLPRRHLIGAGPELSRQVMFTAQLLGESSTVLPAQYWRALTYDRYLGTGWATSGVEATAHRGWEALHEEPGAGMIRVRQRIERVGDESDLLYATGELNSASRPFFVGRRGDGDVFGALVAEQSYEAESFVLATDYGMLEQAREYPGWIGERYLALPDTVPSRVLALARNLTAAEPNAYAQALAIEQYVRSFTYTLDLPAPPAGRDIADYYLFDLQRGYCDYSATAFVVLARAAGLPARLVIGYAPGDREPTTGVVTVTAAVAHSWGEVYFGTVGWVEFEPTGGYAPLQRLPHPSPPPLRRGGEALFTLPALDMAALIASVPLIALSLLALFLFVSAASSIRDEWQAHWANPNDVAVALFRRVRQKGKDLGVVSPASDTALETGQRIAAALRGLVPESDSSALLAVLASQCERAVFSREGVSRVEIRSAGAAYRLLRGTFRRARWRRWRNRLGAA